MTDEQSVTDLLAAVRDELRVTRTIPVDCDRSTAAVDYISSDPRFDNVHVSLITRQLLRRRSKW